MTEVSVQTQIKKLIELQKIDIEIYELKKSLKEKPSFIEGLKNEFEQKKIKLKHLEDKLKVVQLNRRNKELELKTKEEAIAKTNIQLSQLKTNKEYLAKLAEIESIKADKSIFEEEILISYDESDVISKEIDQERTKIGDEEKNFQIKKKEIEGEIKLIEDRLMVLDGQRKQIAPGIEKNLLSRYERILNHKEGLAIASVRDNTCGGCFMNVTQQMINAIKMHDRFVECEICSRILYLEDDL